MLTVDKELIFLKNFYKYIIFILLVLMHFFKYLKFPFPTGISAEKTDCPETCHQFANPRCQSKNGRIKLSHNLQIFRFTWNSVLQNRNLIASDSKTIHSGIHQRQWLPFAMSYAQTPPRLKPPIRFWEHNKSSAN